MNPDRAHDLRRGHDCDRATIVSREALSICDVATIVMWPRLFVGDSADVAGQCYKTRSVSECVSVHMTDGTAQIR